MYNSHKNVHTTYVYHPRYAIYGNTSEMLNIFKNYVDRKNLW